MKCVIIGNIDVIYGSFLLFITNLVGITLSAALTFIVLGFAPVTKAKKGVFYTSIIMALVSIPLILSFMKVVDRNKYFDELNSVKSITLNKETVILSTKEEKVIIPSILQEKYEASQVLCSKYNIYPEWEDWKWPVDIGVYPQILKHFKAALEHNILLTDIVNVYNCAIDENGDLKYFDLDGIKHFN